jgi:hypothetical protein
VWSYFILITVSQVVIFVLFRLGILPVFEEKPFKAVYFCPQNNFNRLRIRKKIT